MEQIKVELAQLFDEMITQVKHFRRKTYEGLFKDCREKYKETIHKIEELCVQASEEERPGLIEQMSAIIPDYAESKIKELSKRQKDRVGVDYNMNMAVFIVPLFSYEHQENCEMIAERMVAMWNERSVTGLTLGQSSYDAIAGGFRKGLCYITTAVCESQHKPDNCYELMALRGYRDTYLMQTEQGRAMVEEYYDIAPAIVQVINMQKAPDAIYEDLYQSHLLPCIQDIQNKEPEACLEKYADMVNKLTRKYLYSQEEK